MTVTNVEILFALLPTDVVSAGELRRGDTGFKVLADAFIAACNTAAAPAASALTWPNPFPFQGAEDPAYVTSLISYATILHGIVAGLVEPAIGGLAPAVPAMLMQAAPKKLAAGLGASTQPRFEIIFGDDKKCVICCKDCHKCEGLLMEAGPVGSSASPFLWKAVSNDMSVTFQVGLMYHFTLQ